MTLLAAATIRADAVVGGTEVSQADFDAKWPFATSIEVIVNGDASLVCSGSVISSQWVLTAGHCTSFITDQAQFFTGYEGTRVLVGNRNRTLATAVDAVQILTHPSHSSGSAAFDFGLIELAEPVSQTPARLSSVVGTGTAGMVAGWGAIEGLADTDTLRSTPVSVVFANSTVLAAQNLFAAVCSGDSGGPLLNHLGHLVGIVSFTATDAAACAPGDVSGYARVSTLMSFLSDAGIPFNEGVDETPPVLSGKSNLLVEATELPIRVPFEPPTAIDAVDGAVPVLCIPASGSVFSQGTHVIYCGAWDAAGNVGLRSFSIRVLPLLSPALVTVPGNLDRPVSVVAGGQAVRLWTSGFESLETVSLRFVSNDELTVDLGSFTTDGNGVVDVRFNVPLGIPRGTGNLVVSGRNGVNRDYMQILVLKVLGPASRDGGPGSQTRN